MNKRRRARSVRTLTPAQVGIAVVLLVIVLVIRLFPDAGVERAPLPPRERVAVAQSQVRVVDGDTVRVDGRPLRLLGVDTPERASSHFTGDQEPWAGEATQFLELRIAEASELQVEIAPTRDHYGRLLGHLYLDGMTASELLVAAGLGYQTIEKGIGGQDQSAYGANGFEAEALRILDAAREVTPAFENPATWRRNHRR